MGESTDDIEMEGYREDTFKSMANGGRVTSAQEGWRTLQTHHSAQSDGGKR